MNNKTREHATFFAALALITLAFAGGIFYFHTQSASDGLLADIGQITVQSSNPNPTPAVETIPTSTIPTSTPSVPSSSTPLVLPLTLPYSFNASTSHQAYWPKAWGNVSFEDNYLALIPDPATHGANSFLQGASSWTNYTVSANASWLMGGWFDIVARVTNNAQNFVYCEFGSNGTEVIERVNGVDTQLAATSASTTNVTNTSEDFGIKVYGNDIACMMADNEVVSARVQNGNESPSGGIGFVIFGAPSAQQQVEVRNISVVPLLRNTIVIPFPVPVVTPPPIVTPPVVVPPPPPVATTTPAPTPPASTTTPTSPTPTPPAPATTTKTLPYFADTFFTGDGWGQSWGTFVEATDSLTIAANSSISSGGALLAGTAGFDNYTFTATLDWVKGETFGMFARHTNNDDYVVCEFDRRFLGDVQMRLEEFVKGNEYVLTQTDLSGYNQVDIPNLVASIEVQDTVGTCSFDGHVITNADAGNTIAPPDSGEVGLTTWDPNADNSEIIVQSVKIASNY